MVNQEPTDLAWGQTPWDNLPREELLRHVQRCYAALETALSVISLQRAMGDTEDAYWRHGVGGLAFDHASEALSLLRGEYDSDQGRTMIYRAFFRYAESLLFADPHTIWWLWDDGEMTGLQPGQSITPREGHTARLFGWDDLLADNGE